MTVATNVYFSTTTGAFLCCVDMTDIEAEDADHLSRAVVDRGQMVRGSTVLYVARDADTHAIFRQGSVTVW